MNRPLLVLILLHLCACTARDATLLDNLRGRRNLPDFGPALSNRGDLAAWFVDAQTIAGYHDEFAFRSEDDFLSLGAFAQDIQPGDTVPAEGYVIRFAEREGFFVIDESLDYGNTFEPWLRFRQAGVIPPLALEGFWFDGVRSGWFFAYSDTPAGTPPIFEPSLRLLRATRDTIEGRGLVDWYDQRVEALRFTSDSVGWALLRPRDGSQPRRWAIAYSTDGGQLWSDPFPLPELALAATVPQLAVSRQSIVVGWRDRSQVWTFDRRSGQWQQRSFRGASGVVVAANVEDLLFAAAQIEDDGLGQVATLWRSEDGGQSWTQASDQPFYADHLRFLPGNPNLCLAYSRDILQITRDRGQTWTLLGFPL